MYIYEKGELIDRKDEEIQYLSSEARLCTKALLCCEYDRLHYERCQGTINYIFNF